MRKTIGVLSMVLAAGLGGIALAPAASANQAAPTGATGAEIAGRIWFDADLNGQQDPDEDGIPADLELVSLSGNHRDNATADENGRFSFTGVPVGDYEVRYAKSSPLISPSHVGNPRTDSDFTEYREGVGAIIPTSVTLDSNGELVSDQYLGGGFHFGG
ncbi:SdrD B-like protein [Tamaricihabitans halophyticus]|uniref:SdrD B-like protein n=1 Tax=Tamaricihabitans halophyticus TaxID=1262583 RepID=A0A4R2R3B7_9PSEU|nr:SdrD B-like domain-containing protein [Tamaricihabitans halophyticus]TCP56334.1 SdrD B-like protein [Tamaricihabitans halophyticus]